MFLHLRDGLKTVVVRDDAVTGNDSTAGLNRDLDKAYEITKDKEDRTDFYVSKSSVEALSDPKATVMQWSKALATYDESAKRNLEQIGIGANMALNKIEQIFGRALPNGAAEISSSEIAEGMV
jgi:filamentous hemagglutinin